MSFPKSASFCALLLLAGGLPAGLPQTVEVRLGEHTFTLPGGLEIEIAAGPPLVDRPIAADFDDDGRLYVADSAGVNDKVEKQLETRPHRIVRLEDADQDGRYERAVVFADRMMFPEGVLWREGSLYVAAPPSIWKLTDVDGDGVADVREEWFQGKTLTGCANDLHGPYLGNDGWIYWAKGAFARQSYERPGREPFVTRAAHIFRSRPDGSGIEAVLTGGMDNPVEVVFTPGGERIISTTFLQHPAGGKRDGLIHAVYGGVYGKVHDVLDDHKKTGDLLPPLTHLGPSAPCGLALYGSRALGEEYHGNLFTALFNLHKVTRHRLEPEGATFRTTDGDFLVSSNPDFHPTDVLEDADGSLLILDTGGWYKICCPTSQLSKPDVLGAIYRVRRPEAPPMDDPRGARLSWSGAAVSELAGRLGEARPAVRRRAIAELARRGLEAAPGLAAVLSGAAAGEARLDALWTLARIEGEEARAGVRRALGDADPTVRQAAAHAAGLWRDRAALQPLLELLADESAQVRRAAAEALGRIGDGSAVPALLGAACGPGDRVLEHSLIYALIEIADRRATRRGLESEKPESKRAALIALDQMDGGELEAARVAALLGSSDALLRGTASWIASHRPDWAGELAGLFRGRLREGLAPGTERQELPALLAQLARHAAGQELLAAVIEDAGFPLSSREIALEAIAGAALKTAPPAWSAALGRLVAAGDARLLAKALQAARRLAALEGAAPLAAPLLELARELERPPGLRLEALAAVPGRIDSLDPELFRLLVEHLEPERPVLTRGSAAAALVRARLERDQLIALTSVMRAAGPLEVNRLLAAFEGVADEELGLELIAALEASPGSAGIRAEALGAWLAKAPAAVRARGEKLLAALDADGAKQRAHLDELAASLPEGDARRGQVVFRSPKAACASCHAIGYLGGTLGPDLTRIGQIRSERDLLEALVYPDASMVRSYEPMVVVSQRGEVITGILRSDAAEAVVLATGPDQEARIPREEIIEMRPGTTSLMPSGLIEQLSREELADLVAFLKAAR
jgi:putative membrane-bound dehydrogenase-like protein